MGEKTDWLKAAAVCDDRGGHGGFGVPAHLGLRRASAAAGCSLAVVVLASALWAPSALGASSASSTSDATGAQIATDTQADASAGATSPSSDASSGETEGSGVTKSQVVYAKTDAAGAQTGVYVVNRFDTAQDCTVSDAGSYLSLANLTDCQALEQRSGSTTFDVATDKTFSYQGDLSAQTALPWEVEIAYRLDGADVDASAVAGATGHLEMTLLITRNADADSVYADNYLLQVSGLFAGDVASNVECADATRAQSGSDAQLSFMVMPGKDVSYTIEADVIDFTFDGWQIVGIPLALSLDIDDAELGGATGDLADLEDAVVKVDDGASKLAEGTASALDGATELDSSSATLTSASGDVKDALAQASTGSQNLAGAIDGQLVAGAEALASGSQTYSDALGAQVQDASLAAAEANTKVEAAQAAYEAAAKAYAQAAYKCGAQGGDPTSDADVADAAGAMADALTELATLQATAAGYKSAATALEGAQTSYSELNAGAQALVNKESSTSVYALQSGADSLASGLAELANQYAGLDDGLATYAGGVASLAEGLTTLNDGAATLADGTGELASETKDLDQQVIDAAKTQLEDYLNPTFAVTDFVNGSTEGMGTVQFVIKTGAIEVSEAEADPADGADETTADESVWQKLLALFGL